MILLPTTSTRSSILTRKRVSEILELLKSFKNEYLDKGQVPKVD